ncbi:MAG: Crp/Fnr family transcriptional regulator [Firmicutes bacterium]|nr:Crp/Fnr family transcriptional regulator [Bacillota bacterium]
MNLTFLTGTALFQGIRETELMRLLSCLQARERSYTKDETILFAGTAVTDIGLVLSGSVNIVLNFYWGSSHILGHIDRGSIFAENYAAIPGQELLCDVVAAEETTVLFLNMNKLMTSCEKGCSFHQQLIRNMLRISARKNLGLSTRMMHIAPKTIRDRVLSYLSAQALENGSPHFRIPFDRRELAEYLGVDRSALSKELGKMQREGLILCRKNEFTLQVRPPF